VISPIGFGCAGHWQDAIGAGSLSDIPAVPSTWSFDVRGRWLGDVNMPTGFQPLRSDRTTSGIMRTDGVNQVVVYDLRVRGR
jgi:hypothetical protein